MSGEPHEIVIIKRVSGGHEDEHHGGVWKIAFADFMTAMMAFFLVMWLISANDKTKAVIARYFNPVQLVDSTPQPKGLEDPKAGSPSVMPKAATGTPEAKDKAEKAEAKTGDAKGGDDKAPAKDKEKDKAETKEPPAKREAASDKAEGKHSEADLMKDPYAVLAEIAGKAQNQPPRDAAKAATEGAKGGAGAVGIKGGAAYRDPFEPMPLPQSAGDLARPKDAGSAAELPTSDTAPQPDQAAAAALTAPQAAAGKADAISPGGKSDAAAEVAATPPSPMAPPAPAAAAASEAARIEAALKQITGTGASAAPRPHVEVQQTGEGTLIDLTDGVDFAMFGSASAEPSSRMVALMEKIGRLLKGEKGRITIRGFTDNRPFRSDYYDNWRLSAARAHMAHYMLVRGGLDEARIDRIEGYADRQPKNPKNPGGPENRRIEILLRDAP